MTRRRFQSWCAVAAYTLGTLAVLGILAIAFRSEVITR